MNSKQNKILLEAVFPVLATFAIVMGSFLICNPKIEREETVVSIKNNPTDLKKGDLVMYIERYRSGKKMICIGEVVKAYGEGYTVKNLKNGELYQPYTQDIFLINEGADIKGIEVKLEETNNI